MNENLINSINERIAYLEKNKAPEDLGPLRMHLLDVLSQARTGKIQELEKIKDQIHQIQSLISNPNTQTRESIQAKKADLAAKDASYSPVFYNKQLQETLNAALDAVSKPALKQVIYMIEIIGPVVALMNDPE